jgi:hypothetical protein
VREGTRTALLVKGQPDEEIVKRVVAAVEDAPPEERIRAGLEAAIDVAETDAVAARSALHSLRSDHERLAQVEAWLGGDPGRATLDLGAAIQIAYAELASPVPDLRSLMSPLLAWLEEDR